MKWHFFVGSNSGPQKAGLRVFELDDATESLAECSRVALAEDPVYFAPSPSGRNLYVAQRMTPNAQGWVGGIARYAVEGLALRLLETVCVAPTVPCYVSVSPDGTQLAWAEYSHAWVGILALQPEGRIGEELARTQHVGSGPNVERQSAAHAHCAIFTPDGRACCVCDLGMDQVIAYDVPTATSGELHPIAGAGLSTAPGAGPRHICFHPSAKVAFLINELDSTLDVLRVGTAGHFERIQTHPLLPEGFTEFSKAAAVKVSPDGNWVLASNRGHDSIAVFRFDATTGRLERRQIVRLFGRYPRDFAFSPDGRYVVVGHKLSNEIALYTFDSQTGEMAPAQSVVSMTKPLCFVFF